MINVIIPNYNDVEHLPQALNSLVCQTHKYFYVTLVDDCSDNSEQIFEILKEYSNKLKINYIRRDVNGGCGEARQTGIDSTPDNIDYITFLDCDDMLYPRALDILYAEGKKNDADVVYSVIMSEQQGAPGDTITAQDNNAFMHGKLYKLSFLRKNNIRFLPGVRYNEDGYFNVVVSFYKEKGIAVDEITYLWRDNKQSTVRSCNYDIVGGPDYIYAQAKAVIDSSGHISKTANELLMINIINIYNQCQILNYYNVDYDHNVIKQLFEVPEVKTIWDKHNSRVALNNKLQGCKYTSRGFILFSQLFLDWVKQFNTEAAEILIRSQHENSNT